MNTHEMSGVFDGILTGLGPFLKDKDRKEIQNLSEFFRRVPNQPLPDFVLRIEKSLQGDRLSVAALTERVRKYRESNGEPAEDILADIRKLTDGDVGKILRGEGLPSVRGKEEKIASLRALLLGEPIPQPATPLEFIDGLNAYRALKSSVSQLTYAEIRAGFEPIGKLSKDGLAYIAENVGFHTKGTKAELSAKLLGNLEGIRGSIDQTSRI